MELLKVDSLEAAREKLFRYAGNWKLAAEKLPFEQADGRVLAGDILSPENVPAFSRSTVDGYAVLSGDTAAAGESIPVFLRVMGQVEMGKGTSLTVKSGQCVEVPTGGMLPDGADAVVMLEYCEAFGDGGIAVGASVAHGENTVLPGEDVKKGGILLRRGTVLRPRHIGALAAAGVHEASVYQPLRLAVISTGDELKDTRSALSPGEVRDINSYALSSLARRSGYCVVRSELLPDDEGMILSAVRRSMADCDVVLISGGSSKGKKDDTHKIINAAASPGVFTHGLAMKPGKPTILGYDADSGTLIGGLPGHPVAAIMVFEMLLSALYREITGTREPPSLTARLSSNIAASPGKLTCIPVRLEKNAEGWEALPVFGKSGLITTLRNADGYIAIDRNREGLNAGEPVEVRLF